MSTEVCSFPMNFGSIRVLSPNKISYTVTKSENFFTVIISIAAFPADLLQKSIESTWLDLLGWRRYQTTWLKNLNVPLFAQKISSVYLDPMALRQCPRSYVFECFQILSNEIGLIQFPELDLEIQQIQETYNKNENELEKNALDVLLENMKLKRRKVMEEEMNLIWEQLRFVRSECNLTKEDDIYYINITNSRCPEILLCSAAEKQYRSEHRQRCIDACNESNLEISMRLVNACFKPADDDKLENALCSRTYEDMEEFTSERYIKENEMLITEHNHCYGTINISDDIKKEVISERKQVEDEIKATIDIVQNPFYDDSIELLSLTELSPSTIFRLQTSLFCFSKVKHLRDLYNFEELKGNFSQIMRIIFELSLRYTLCEHQKDLIFCRRMIGSGE